MARRRPRLASVALCGVAEGELGRAASARLRATAARVKRGKPPLRAPALEGVSALLVDIGVPVPAEVIEGAADLRYIGVFGTGFAEVDVAAAARRRIVVTNVPGYATRSVAEFTVAAALSELRRLPAVHAGKTRDPARLRGRELAGRSLGVVGAGRIGAEVARIAHDGFGARVSYWSRHRKPALERGGIPYRPLDRLLGGSDIVSLHVALNEQTAGLLGARRLARLRAGCLVLNFASAGVVDTGALLKRLRAGDVGYALDHEDELPPGALRLLRRLPLVRLYPPIGYETEEARAARAETFVSNIEAFLEGRPRNVVSRRS